MARNLIGTLLLSLICLPASAILIGQFENTDAFISRAKEIIVAECVSVPEQHETFSMLQAIEVNVLKTLKGHRKPGPLRIVTHPYSMEPDTRYLLCSNGGEGFGSNFFAVAQLAVVPLPKSFELKELEGKSLKEQVQYMFSLRLFELERELAPLLDEKALLEKGVSDREYLWFESSGPATLGPVVDCSTQTDGAGLMWLALEDARLAWSHSTPGKTGFFYFEKIGTSWTPYWEFAPCDADTLEDLAGKPLKAQFYGLYTPGRADSDLGFSGTQSIKVSVGQVLLARTVDNPSKVYAIQIVDQPKSHEAMTARYAVIQD